MISLQQRKPRYILAAVALLAAGFFVTFTPLLHEDLRFNSWIITGFAIVFTLFAFMTWRLAAKDKTQFVYILASASGLLLTIAAITASVAGSVFYLRLALMIWAAINAAGFAIAWLLAKSRAMILTAIYFAAFLLAVAVLGTSLSDAMGFFAAFCIVAGVFIGISAFDPQQHSLQESSENTGIA